MGQIFSWRGFLFVFGPHSSHPTLFYRGAPASGIFHKPLRPLQWELIPPELASRLHLGESCRSFVANVLQIEFPAPILRANRSLCGLVLIGTLPAGWAVGKWFTQPGPTRWGRKLSLKTMMRKLEKACRNDHWKEQMKGSHTHNDFNFAKIKGVGGLMR